MRLSCVHVVRSHDLDRNPLHTCERVKRALGIRDKPEFWFNGWDGLRIAEVELRPSEN